MLSIILLITFATTVLSGSLDYTILGCPYTVAIKTSSGIYGGAVVRPLFVLTTASWLEGKKPADLEIHAGTDKYTEGEIHAVSKIFIHKAYVKATFDNDVALLLVKETFRFTTDVIKQVFVATEPATDVDVHKLTGFGASKNYNHIQMGIINTLTIEECKAVPNYTENKFCSANFNTDAEDGSCMAEIGAPAVAALTGKLSGVLSSRDGCKGTIVFTDVAKVGPWIQEIFAQNGR